MEKNELECLECEFSSRSAYVWCRHLKEKHSTTPTLAGCILRCQCGYETFSYAHSQKCHIANFTIIRNGSGPIQRLADPP
ncbi:hypothetical protein PMAYCL1PPCAC_01489, partial [Pristionchus mayeri]